MRQVQEEEEDPWDAIRKAKQEIMPTQPQQPPNFDFSSGNQPAVVNTNHQ
jgi:hypothetical protein